MWDMHYSIGLGKEALEKTLCELPSPNFFQLFCITVFKS